MALAGKSSGTKTPLRPGITQSHRGRLVRNVVVGAVLLAFGFMMFSNSLNPKEEEEQLSPEEKQMVEFEMENNINNDPETEPAPANPFDMRTVANLPAGFEGTASYNNLVASAEEVAAQVSTYSSNQTPEEYVKTVENIDDDMKAELLKSSKKTWPEIEKADITVKGEDAGIDPVIREYNENSTLASVEVVVKQTVTHSNGTSTSQTRAYLMNLVGVEQGNKDIAWTVGGFQKQ